MDEIFDIYNQQIGQSKSSIFTKEDVLKLFSEFYSNIVKFKPEESAITEATELQFQEFSSNVRNRLYQYFNNTDLVDYDSVEFEIEYNNQIVLSNVNVDLDSWSDEFDDIMLDEFQATFNNPIK